ncbi:Gfo/Idh/MocA family oxidoreductase [Bacillaceae bacterium SIJ1]|uniref:Gfo/Idh/MocA family protein n=1 Tax=Litoribacterium kuwaitense TaxID=1398745 RepID=UPI0013EB05B6|nr:Gfo/Idh/MocA family oxidoreductase [Litoribacterium kuwaitense]NGP45940.1 Gfo/Idh/MocA family oxidoreductase [Litoribacterium kuwaitense]
MRAVIIAGSGHMGKSHAKEWRTLGVTIAGVVSRSGQAGEEEAWRGIPVFPSLQDALAETKGVDAVDICLPTYLHKEAIETVAAAKKAVVCEKPLALSSQEARAIIQVCKDNGVALYPGHVLRFHNEYALARQKVKDGAIGQPGVFRLARKNRYPYNGEPSWYSDETKSGGVTFDLGIHDFDWILWTLGHAERIMARRVKRASTDRPVDYVLAVIRMENGAMVHVELSWEHDRFESSFELSGQNGMLTHSSADTEAVKWIGPVTEQDKVPTPKSTGPSPMFKQLQHFIRCHRGEETLQIQPEDALRAIELAEAVVQSAEEGRPVELKGGVVS